MNMNMNSFSVFALLVYNTLTDETHACQNKYLCPIVSTVYFLNLIKFESQNFYKKKANNVNIVFLENQIKYSLSNKINNFFHKKKHSLYLNLTCNANIFIYNKIFKFKRKIIKNKFVPNHNLSINLCTMAAKKILLF